VPGFSWLRLIALIAFAGTYLGLALGRLPGFRVDRTGVAIIGATVMVVGGVLPWEQAVAAVDAQTLVLLFGMMIVAAYLRLSGFFHLVTHWAVRRARGPVGLLAVVVLASGVLSALFVNDVICIVLTPVVLALVRQFRLPPVPYLLALATAANVGSVATLTGNPQNMLIGSFSGISYRAFLAHQAPVAALGLACVLGVLWLAIAGSCPPSSLP
jgi:Na+/H+ antiporter NhaD/arsenite permease-like protein